MKLLSFLPLFALGISACAEVSVAAEKETLQAKTVSATAQTEPLVVAELFTSQGCSSCPPAERLFSTLAERDDVLTMEWHVDIWDDLVHGGSKWKDVYSNEEFTRRQRYYNRSLRGKTGIYTPQAIVNGQWEGVGSRQHEVSDMLQAASPLSIDVKIENNIVSVQQSSQSVDVIFVRLLKAHETDIKGGENKGRQLAGKNIVLDAEVIGQTGNNPVQFNLPPVGAGESCAVLVQALGEDIGPILGAAKCT